MIAMPPTAIIWLFFRRGRKARRDVAVSAIAAVAGLCLCALAYGPDFFANLFTSRDYSFSHVLGNVGHLQWSALAIVIWLIWVARSRSAAARFTLVHVPVALFACILQWFGDKIYGNAEFDLMIALGIAVGVAFEEIKSSPFARHLGESGSRTLMVLILLLRLIATDRQEPLLVMFDPVFRGQFLLGELAVHREARMISLLDEYVYCSVKVVCRVAGKPFAVDDFKVEEMVATKQIAESDLDALLKARQITKFANSPATMAAADTSLSLAWARGSIRP
jgi:hypothetical protein